MGNKSHIFGYLLGLLIFVIGIPALMWLVSGRPWPYAPDSAVLCVVSLILAVCGLALSIYSIIYMRLVGKGNPFDAYGHEVAPRTKHLMTSGPYRLCRNPMRLEKDFGQEYLDYKKRVGRYRFWILFAVLTFCGTASFASCSSNEVNATEQSNITTNGQYSVFILSTYTDIPCNGKVAEILDRGTILFGTTGDYRPLSFREANGTYWGFGIEVAKEIANKLGVNIEFKKTSWPTLTADVLTEPQLFDLAIGGITITDARRETMLMSDGYLANGKTILCRASEANRYKSLADIDKPEVSVMVNPGGLNEKFANENLTHATIIVHQKNEEIPTLVAEGQADVMITEITEAPYYVQTDTRLAAPLLNAPFTHGEIGVLMQKGQEDLLQMVNNVISQMKKDGSLRKLHEKYGLVYAYE